VTYNNIREPSGDRSFGSERLAGSDGGVDERSGGDEGAAKSEEEGGDGHHDYKSLDVARSDSITVGKLGSSKVREISKAFHLW